MLQKKHAASLAETTIHRLIELLHKLFVLGTEKKAKLDELIKKRTELDEKNPDYTEVRQDKRENMKMFWLLLLIISGMAIDFILVYQPMEIICATYHLPISIKYLAPILLIIMEVGIAYFQILHHRDHNPSSLIMRNLQYLVIVILGCFSALPILFTINSYDASLDGSFIGFITGTVLFQLGLFCASVMLHLWLIKNAEDLSETIAYFLYLIARSRISLKIGNLEKEIKEKHSRDFRNNSRNLVHTVELYKRNNPGADMHFEKAMPMDLIQAINGVMGKIIFPVEMNQVV